MLNILLLIPLTYGYIHPSPTMPFIYYYLHSKCYFKVIITDKFNQLGPSILFRSNRLRRSLVAVSKYSHTKCYNFVNPEAMV